MSRLLISPDLKKQFENRPCDLTGSKNNNIIYFLKSNKNGGPAKPHNLITLNKSLVSSFKKIGLFGMSIDYKYGDRLTMLLIEKGWELVEKCSFWLNPNNDSNYNEHEFDHLAPSFMAQSITELATKSLGMSMLAEMLELEVHELESFLYDPKKYEKEIRYYWRVLNTEPSDDELKIFNFPIRIIKKRKCLGECGLVFSATGENRICNICKIRFDWGPNAQNLYKSASPSLDEAPILPSIIKEAAVVHH